MDIKLQPGRYLVAVSGGVDSVVLLEHLVRLPGLKLTVAHFDHGMRDDSGEDERFVKNLAHTYGLPYVYERAELGPDVSEAAAREARYAFLRKAREAAGAEAILTAHHQDDLLETALHNIIRGTGRRGLSSLKSTNIVKRPLLDIPKADILEYAYTHKLHWREDPTNQKDIYTRNYIRHHLIPRLGDDGRQKLIDIINESADRNAELDTRLARTLEQLTERGKLKRQPFIMLTHAVAREVMHAWLRQHDIRDIDSKMLERLVHAAKTFHPVKLAPAGGNIGMQVGKEFLALVRIER